MEQQDDNKPTDGASGNTDKKIIDKDKLKETDSEAVIQRGQAGIKADEMLSATSKKEQAEDAEKWRNEG